MSQKIKIGELDVSTLTEDKENELLEALAKRKEERSKFNSEFVIIRSAQAGVFFGIPSEIDASKGVVTLNKCRRLWYWTGGASISQLASEGSDKRENKFTVRTNNHHIMGVIEIIPCTEVASKRINSVPEWKA